MTGFTDALDGADRGRSRGFHLARALLELQGFEVVAAVEDGEAALNAVDRLSRTSSCPTCSCPAWTASRWSSGSRRAHDLRVWCLESVGAAPTTRSFRARLSPASLASTSLDDARRPPLVRRLTLVALACAGVALGLVAEQQAYAWQELSDWLADLAAGWTLIGLGIALAPAAHAVGCAPLLAGFSWFAFNFEHTGPAAVQWLAVHAAYLHR